MYCSWGPQEEEEERLFRWIPSSFLLRVIPSFDSWRGFLSRLLLLPDVSNAICTFLPATPPCWINKRRWSTGGGAAARGATLVLTKIQWLKDGGGHTAVITYCDDKQS